MLLVAADEIVTAAVAGAANIAASAPAPESIVGRINDRMISPICGAD
jgi:hypothetical protein